MYSQWSAANVGDTWMPSRPPSPSVPDTSGTVPATVRVPSGATLTTSWVSRSVMIPAPSGRKSSPHGTSVPASTGVTSPTGSRPARVVTGPPAPAGERFPAASAATTVKVYVVRGARPCTATVFVLVVATTVAPLRTVYPVTPTSSVAGSHASVTLLAVTAVART